MGSLIDLWASAPFGTAQVDPCPVIEMTALGVVAAGVALPGARVQDGQGGMVRVFTQARISG